MEAFCVPIVLLPSEPLKDLVLAIKKYALIKALRLCEK